MKAKNDTKPMRNAIAVVLRHPDKPGAFLVVKRPNETSEGGALSGVWGLPATRMREGELPEDAARRVCREKLGCDAVPLHLVGTMFQQRDRYEMFFMDVEMLLVGDSPPDVAAARTDSTVYVAQRWVTDGSVLLPAAKNGSCCSTIFLTSQGLLDKSEWVTTMGRSKAVA